MRTRSEKMNVRVISFAVQGALAAMCAAPLTASADDDKLANLTQPTNTIEVGAANVSKTSAKFGEYNGMEKDGAYFIGNFSVRGGDAYNGGNGTGTTRWGFTGTDLGTTSRELGANISNQGQWKLNFGYDELRHNISDTYQTPLQSSGGGSILSLPTSFGVINAQATRTGNAANPVDPVLAAVPGIPAGTLNGTAPSTRVLTATQKSLLHTEDVGTTRKNTSFNAGFDFNRQLSVQFDFNHLAQSGAKLISAANYGNVVNPLPATGTAWRAEAYTVLMNPTDYKTDTFNLALNWVGDQGHLTGGYFVSIFRNDHNSLTWNSPISGGAAGNLQTAACGAGTTSATCYYTGVMSAAPDNNFHQLNLTGGYAFSSATKLAGGFSYGRNTQGGSFLGNPPEYSGAAVPVAPVGNPTSLHNDLVVTTHADLKLSHQATKELALTAGLKYDERDNRSDATQYRFWVLNSLTTPDAATNAPYSNKRSELELAGDYRIDKKQTIRLAYNYEKVDRWCNDYNVSGNTHCVVSPSSDEDKFGIKYRLKASSDVSFNAGYTYAKRKSDFNHNAVTPLSGLDTLTPHDVNAQDYPGFVAYTYASRKQEQFKAGVNWRPNEQLDLGLTGRYAKDDYYDSTLGVQDRRTAGVNLDATYTYNRNSSVSAYASWQDSKRDLRSGASGAGAQNVGTSFAALVAPTNIFTNTLDESSNAVGLVTKHTGLMGGKLELLGDLSYSYDESGYNTKLRYALASCSATNETSCGALPDITSRLVTFKLTGTYLIDKASKVALGYVYQNRDTHDYYYNTTKTGYTPARGLPTNEQAPNYSVNVVGVSYTYSFK